MRTYQCCQAKFYPLDFCNTYIRLKDLKDLFDFKREINPKGYVLWVKRYPYDLFNVCAGGTSVRYTVKDQS